MPYIQQEQRDKFDQQISNLSEAIEKNTNEISIDGVLNYIISRLIHEHYTPSYFNYNKAIGMLECAKLELYRRLIGPYEDTKIKINGDL